MVIYLYRWKISPEKEGQFEKAWSRVTAYLREECGSLGSRLHRGDDGLWYGYAQWPSAEARAEADLERGGMPEALRLMKDATIGNFPATVLTPVSDFLVLPEKDGK
ncbi:MAG: antibiotic biosynthesis monooxygenase [Alphaproteobacteria bacterium]|nr:antibiotic biosynthesis monooxygenase [Alphaproteobacteria bacterium]